MVTECFGEYSIGPQLEESVLLWRRGDLPHRGGQSSARAIPHCRPPDVLPYAYTDNIYVSTIQVKIWFLDIIANKLVLTHITALERHLLKKTPDPLMNQIIPLPRPLPRRYHKSRELPQASRKLTVTPVSTHLQQHLVLGVKPIDPDFSELSRVVVRSCGRAGRATRRCSAEDVVCGITCPLLTHAPLIPVAFRLGEARHRLRELHHSVVIFLIKDIHLSICGNGHSVG